MCDRQSAFWAQPAAVRWCPRVAARCLCVLVVCLTGTGTDTTAQVPTSAAPSAPISDASVVTQPQVGATVAAGATAVAAGSAAATAQPTATEALEAGVAALDRGDLAAALPLLQSAAERLPNQVDAWLQLARCAYLLGQVDSAISAWQRVQTLSPGEPTSKAMLAALSNTQAKDFIRRAEALVDAGMPAIDGIVSEALAGKTLSASDAAYLRLLGIMAGTWQPMQPDVLPRTQPVATKRETLASLLAEHPSLADHPRALALVGVLTAVRWPAGESQPPANVTAARAAFERVIERHAGTPYAWLATIELAALTAPTQANLSRVLEQIAAEPPPAATAWLHRRVLAITQQVLTSALLAGDKQSDPTSAVPNATELLAVDAARLSLAQLARRPVLSLDAPQLQQLLLEAELRSLMPVLRPSSETSVERLTARVNLVDRLIALDWPTGRRQVWYAARWSLIVGGLEVMRPTIASPFVVGPPTDEPMSAIPPLLRPLVESPQVMTVDLDVDAIRSLCSLIDDLSKLTTPTVAPSELPQPAVFAGLLAADVLRSIGANSRLTVSSSSPDRGWRSIELSALRLANRLAHHRRAHDPDSIGPSRLATAVLDRLGQHASPRLKIDLARLALGVLLAEPMAIEQPSYTQRLPAIGDTGNARSTSDLPKWWHQAGNHRVGVPRLNAAFKQLWQLSPSAAVERWPSVRGILGHVAGGDHWPAAIAMLEQVRDLETDPSSPLRQLAQNDIVKLTAARVASVARQRTQAMLTLGDLPPMDLARDSLAELVRQHERVESPTLAPTVLTDWQALVTELIKLEQFDAALAATANVATAQDTPGSMLSRAMKRMSLLVEQARRLHHAATRLPPPPGISPQAGQPAKPSRLSADDLRSLTDHLLDLLLEPAPAQVDAGHSAMLNAQISDDLLKWISQASTLCDSAATADAYGRVLERTAAAVADMTQANPATQPGNGTVAAMPPASREVLIALREQAYDRLVRLHTELLTQALADAANARSPQQVSAPTIDQAAGPQTLPASAQALVHLHMTMAWPTGHRGVPATARRLIGLHALAMMLAEQNRWTAAAMVFEAAAPLRGELAEPHVLNFALAACDFGQVQPYRALNHLRDLVTPPEEADDRISDDDALSDMLTLPATPSQVARVRRQAEKLKREQEQADEGRRVDDSDPIASVLKPAAPVAAEPQESGTDPGQPPADAPAVQRLQERASDMQMLAVVRQKEQQRASNLGRLGVDRGPASQSGIGGEQSGGFGGGGGGGGGSLAVFGPMFSDAELARQQVTIDRVMARLVPLANETSRPKVSRLAQVYLAEMLNHWRNLREFDRAIALTQQALKEIPALQSSRELRLALASDHDNFGRFGARSVKGERTAQQQLAHQARQSALAQAVRQALVAEFAFDASFVLSVRLTMAREMIAHAESALLASPTVARGWFVRGARELLSLQGSMTPEAAALDVSSEVSSLANQLASRGMPEEAIVLWRDLIARSAGDPQNARRAIARTYEAIGRPLKAVELYMEISSSSLPADQQAQTQIYTIGNQLQQQRRWLEAFQVLDTFVNSFPQHPEAGKALLMVGQVHQVNEAWTDAITAYSRVLDEYAASGFVADAQWAIAECEINLSEWAKASASYETFATRFAQDGRTTEARRRQGVLKDLARYQTLVDEAGQRKGFDAQFQIAQIVQSQLGNVPKAIIEYRKVAAQWPSCHLADDALFAVGQASLAAGDTEKARVALQEVATRYPDSPLADDAWFEIGRSYEQEADRIAGVQSRQEELDRNWRVTQNEAYNRGLEQRKAQRASSKQAVQSLRDNRQTEDAELLNTNSMVVGGQLDVALGNNFSNAAMISQMFLTASQLADLQDRVNASLRSAVNAYTAAAGVPQADRAGDALLKMATIYDERLKDSQRALDTWLEIVRQFTGTSVAEDASWRIAGYYERRSQWEQAADAYKAFVRNYRASPRAAEAQFQVAECFEQLGLWVQAMDAYTNFINSHPESPMVQKARDQINWIKQYRL